mmetsp:Transcript_34244/g.108665  ORF Transcript_34244/g.108665 Transcript_34244/m.108665 type:complete len:211 (-) Transcript_34244:3-635(-)
MAQATSKLLTSIQGHPGKVTWTHLLHRLGLQIQPIWPDNTLLEDEAAVGPPLSDCLHHGEAFARPLVELEAVDGLQADALIARLEQRRLDRSVHLGAKRRQLTASLRRHMPSRAGHEVVQGQQAADGPHSLRTISPSEGDQTSCGRLRRNLVRGKVAVANHDLVAVSSQAQDVEQIGSKQWIQTLQQTHDDKERRLLPKAGVNVGATANT